MRMTKLQIGIVTVVMVGTMAAGVWAAPTADTKALVAAHRQAAVEAQQKAAFHEEMAKKFVEGKGNSKIDLAGHCRTWAAQYRQLADNELRAAKELE